MADERVETTVELDQDLYMTVLLDPGHEIPNAPVVPDEAGPATGATAGIPGEWIPASSTPPADPSSCDVTANPDTPWTTGQFVQTQLTGAAGRCTWTGTAWVGGVAP